MKKTFRILAALLIASLFSGCANMQAIKKDTLAEDMNRLKVNSEEDLNAMPPIIKIPITKKELILIEPDVFKSKQNISLSFDKVDFKKAMRIIAKKLNLNIIFDYENPIKLEYEGAIKGAGALNQTPTAISGSAESSGSGSYTVSGKPDRTKIDYFNRTLSIDFKGPVTELFKYFSETTNYFYSFTGSSLVIKESQTFKINVPSYPGLLKEIGSSLEKLGGRNISYDEISNNIAFTADYLTYKRIEDYTNDLRNNMALISLRIIILNVKLTGEDNYGIDWSKLNIGYGTQKVITASGNRAASDGSTGLYSDFASAATGMTKGAAAIGNSTGTGLFIDSTKFTLSAFANFLETYGKGQMIQNVYVQTLSGKKARLNSLTKTPYVSSVGVSSLSNNSAATTSAASTEKANNGVTLEVQPWYSKSEGTLTINLNVVVSGVLRMLTLSAGTLGSFQQPETTEKSVETTLRMSPSQTAIIGGLIFEQKSDSTATLPVETYLTGTAQNSKQKEELIVIAKPQVFVFEESN